MLYRHEDINAAALAEIGFVDAPHAASALRALPGGDITDSVFEQLLPLLLDALAASPDPDRALRNFSAWRGRVGSAAMYVRLLTEHPAALDAMLQLFAVSQFLADILVRNPEYFEVIANPRIRDRRRTMDDFLADARRRTAIASTPGRQRDALRRFKPPEVLRTGARDILGYASLDETIAEISDFAEACVRAAVEICGAAEKFAVIGMGKLGGRELNYASDIDLIFVHDDSLDPAAANKLGEAVRDAIASVTDAGFLFRVDLRLRPEGRFGAISRSLSACRAYYESWAEPWERQALLKARVVGGDSVVGAQFIDIAQKFVYRKMVTEDFVQSIKANKRRMEEQIARAGESDTNVKQGVGGIRDIEFTVQILQLVAGAQHSELRVGATLPALDGLAKIGLIDQTERDMLAESYRFLRNVEHRLQIMDERPVRNIPLHNPAELNLFGRRLGYADGAAFLAEYRRHTSRVHAAFQEMFVGGAGEEEMGFWREAEPVDPASILHESGAADISALVESIGDPAARENLGRRLEAMGFADIAASIALLQRSELGGDYGAISPEARERFAQLAPRLLAGASATSAPDTALAGFDQLSIAAPSRAALYRSLIDEPLLLERLLILAADGSRLWPMLIGHLEYLDLLGDESQLDTPATPPHRTDAESVARFVRRERLRIAARDLWGLADTRETVADLTSLADAVLAAALALPGFDDIASDIAVIGLGKLGGRELGYGSDLDVLWVVEEGADTQRAALLAAKAMAFVRDGLKPYGAAFEIDARLRPDGRVGVLARTTAGYAKYLAESAQTWEKQALIKARPVAGYARAGTDFIAMARGVVFGRPLDDEQAAEMRHMKFRIETERCKYPLDIKLGPGGLSDIEWTAQLLQWRHGKRWPKAQTTGTLDALDALRDAGVMRQDDWEMLTQAYLDLTALRNREWLREGRGDITAEGLSDRRGRVREVFLRLFGTPSPCA